ncbi:hypothetical protein [Halonotius roseus]|uniref:Uncharacterized protein n=1 Tax=Halonotius roseus TaxID=2511997 RepID=A0A544QNF2_9EURY|nr:hypothetical protein [Halonotius roseus]TQQ80446.1 hypothetical protein EWF95_08125 [Halonotius roseus]
MPISTDEFDAGAVDESDDEPNADDEVDPIETEKDLVTSFLSERPDRAFTEREIVLGVDYTPVFMDRTQSSLGSFADGLIDFAGDVAATTIVVNDIDDALTELVEEGIVTTKEVETDDGTSVYYTLA